MPIVQRPDRVLREQLIVLQRPEKAEVRKQKLYDRKVWKLKTLKCERVFLSETRLFDRVLIGGGK